MDQNSRGGSQSETHRHLKIAEHNIKVVRSAHHGRQPFETLAAVQGRLDLVATRREHAHSQLDDEGRILDW